MKINKDHQIINSLRISSYSKYNFLIENNDDCHELYDFIRLKRLPYVVIGREQILLLLNTLMALSFKYL